MPFVLAESVERMVFPAEEACPVHGAPDSGGRSSRLESAPVLPLPAQELVR